MESICKLHNLEYYIGCFTCKILSCPICIQERRMCENKNHKLLLCSQYRAALEEEENKQSMDININILKDRDLKNVIQILKNEFEELEKKQRDFEKSLKAMTSNIMCNFMKRILEAKKFIHIKIQNLIKLEELSLRCTKLSLNEDKTTKRKLFTQLKILPELIQNCKFQCDERIEIDYNINHKFDFKNICKPLINILSFKGLALKSMKGILNYSRNQIEIFSTILESKLEKINRVRKYEVVFSILSNTEKQKYLRLCGIQNLFEKYIIIIAVNSVKPNPGIKYQSRKSPLYIQSFNRNIALFKNRKRGTTLKEKQKKKRKEKDRKNTLALTLKLDAFSKKVFDLERQITFKEIFKNSIFRCKGKAIAFERKRVCSPYLFYAIMGSPMVFHLLNLISSKTIKPNIYNNTSLIDIEQHENKIYICGGYDGSNYLDSNYSLDLSNIYSASPQKMNPLKYPRRYLTLVSTPFDLFSLGGENSSGNVKICERFDKNSNWQQTEDLNSPSYILTSSFIYPYFIYKFGCTINASIEKIDIKHNSKWTKLEVVITSNRGSGCPLQLNENEIFLINGNGAPNEFQKYLIKENQIVNTGKSLSAFYYFHSKLRICGFHGYIISSYSNKKAKIDLEKLHFEELIIGF